jgi:hypothetical protein
VNGVKQIEDVCVVIGTTAFPDFCYTRLVVRLAVTRDFLAEISLLDYAVQQTIRYGGANKKADNSKHYYVARPPRPVRCGSDDVITKSLFYKFSLH